MSGVAGRARVVAIVLARAGSKGVPGKNRAPVAGRPCAAWTLDAARRSSLVDTVVLSTDDAELKPLARGIRVIDRPAELATDRSTVDDAARHAVEGLERAGIGCDAAVILYANVPVRPEGLIDDAVRLLLETGCDSVQSYCPVGKHHPWWTVRVESGDGNERGTVRPWEGDVLYHNTFRRQDLPPAYVPDGGVCAVTRRSLFRQIAGVPAGPHAFLGRDRRAVITGEGAVIDIDSPIDLLVANAILGGAADEGRAACAPPLVRTA